MKGLRAKGEGLVPFPTRSSAALSPKPPVLASVRPLLKWAGGKRQLLPHLRRFYPPVFNRYIEPFFGSGAVYFDLYGAGRLRDRESVLIDSNADLIGCYETVRTRPDEVAAELDRLAAAHARSGDAQYYAVRDEQFNPTRDRLRGSDGRIAYTPQLAAMLIYLNRTGFNGLYRVNARGAFNVPAGRYERPKIVDRVKLAGVAEALAAANVTLVCGSFETVEQIATAGDFVYFDPPYAPVSRTANFTSYTGPRFTEKDQERLQRLATRLADRGCFVLLSNSTADQIAELYERNMEARAAGLRAVRVPARRSINSNAAKRGTVAEYLISNVNPVLL
jgi:DNA adenine methylase